LRVRDKLPHLEEELASVLVYRIQMVDALDLPRK
jgi:hypothetical protein